MLHLNNYFLGLLKKLIILFVVSTINAEKVLILTQAYNQPKFIELQYRLYKKFLKDDFEIIIYDNSEEGSHFTNEIRNVCNNLNIKYVRIPQSIHSNLQGYNIPSERNSNSINYSFKDAGIKHNGIVAIIASDIFLTKEFSIANYMKNSDIIGFHQERGHVKYLWDHIIFLRTSNLDEKEQLDFGCGYVDNIVTDVGGKLYPYLSKHSHLKKRYIDQIYIKDSNIRVVKEDIITASYDYETALKKLNFSSAQIDFILSGIDNIEFLIDNTFLHYRNGSMYDYSNQNLEYHKKKTDIMKKFIDSII